MFLTFLLNHKWFGGQGNAKKEDWGIGAGDVLSDLWVYCRATEPNQHGAEEWNQIDRTQNKIHSCGDWGSRTQIRDQIIFWENKVSACTIKEMR